MFPLLSSSISIHRYREEGPNQERSLPRAITPTHEFVAVSFVEFVFLLEIWFSSSLSSPPPTPTLIFLSSLPFSIPLALLSISASLFKVPYIRSPLRQKTRVILEIHVSYCFVLFFPPHFVLFFIISALLSRLPLFCFFKASLML